jgi:hypothetical protein
LQSIQGLRNSSTPKESAAQGKRRREREVEVGAKEMGSVAILGKTKGTGILQTVHTSAPL